MDIVSTLARIDPSPIILSLQLAGMTSVILLLLATPLAWWLVRSSWRYKAAIDALVALPLVLPPTVLGFYLLLALGPHGIIGGAWQDFAGTPLTFTFTGLLIASIFYSLPFAVQPVRAAFEAVGEPLLEAAWCLRATRLNTFFTIVLPLSIRGYVTAFVLCFAHTLGEFGVVLMVGGNIPGETKVLSIEIYDHVETLDYATAHILSAGLLLFSFITLLIVYTINSRSIFRHETPSSKA